MDQFIISTSIIKVNDVRKILILILVFMLVFAVSVSAHSEEDMRSQITDLLFEYKDAYNLRDFEAIKNLYTADALIMSFPCDSNKEVFFNEFSEGLGLCSTYWVESAFKLRLFKITSFEVEGDKCSARILWDYRDNKNRGKFTPMFEFTKINGKWKISKETYGRKEG